MKKIYIKENQISKQLLLPDFLFKAVKEHQTSLGDNPAFPSEDDYPFDYVILKERYAQVCLAMKDVGIEIVDGDALISMLSDLVTRCKELERPIRDTLERVCENAINKMFAIPDGALNIKCKLTDRIKYKNSICVTPESSSESGYKFKDIDERELSKKAIAKRRFINSLVMGASEHFSSCKIFYEEDIANINPELLELYDKIVTINDYLLFTTEEVITDEKPKQGSYVEVHVGKNGNRTNIEAQGVIFPLLLHDTIKGLFELFSVYGLPDDKEKAKYIIKKSDFILAEPWDIRLGTILWDIVFGKIGEFNIIPYVFMELVSLPTDEFNMSMREILAGTEKGDEIMNTIIEKSTYNSGYQEFKNRINLKNIDKSLINDSYFTAAELDGFELDGEDEDGDVIAEDSAESALWNGKRYDFWNDDTNCITFVILNDGTYIQGNKNNDEAHEEIIMMYCYRLLDEQPPLNELGNLNYSRAVDEIQVNHSNLFLRLTNSIKIQGRVFETDDENYVFTCYEHLDDDDAKEMMAYVSFKVGLPKDRCYYVGHYNTVIIPLMEAKKE